MGASLIAQLVKNLPAMQETSVGSLAWEDPLEEGKATPKLGSYVLMHYLQQSVRRTRTIRILCRAENKIVGFIILWESLLN